MMKNEKSFPTCEPSLIIGYDSVMFSLCAYFNATKLKYNTTLVINKKDRWHNVINFDGNF